MNSKLISKLDKRYVDELKTFLPEYQAESSASIKSMFIDKTTPKQKASKKSIVRMLLVAAVIVAVSTVTALSFSETFRQFVFGSPANVIILDDEGEGTLVIDKISQEDIYNLMRLILDEDGNLVPDAGVLRQKFVTDLDRFSIIDENGRLHEVEGVPFTVELHSSGEGEFEYIFYSIDVNDKVIAIPSEWDVMAFLYLVDANASNFFACTDTGIYRIDPVAQTATLISSIEYNEVPYEELFDLFLDSRGFHLTWIANPQISPDGLWISFQSNRNDVNSLPSFRESLWVLNTQTGEERMIPVNNEYTQVPEGYLWSNILLVRNVGGRVEAGLNLSVVDLTTGSSEWVRLGHLPNAHINAIYNSGLLAIQVSDDDGVREVVIRVSGNGNANIVFEVEGHLHYVRFSPCGTKIAAVRRETHVNLGRVVDTVIVIDAGAGKIKTLSELEDAVHASALSWVSSNQFLVTENVAEGGRIREKTVLYTIR